MPGPANDLNIKSAGLVGFDGTATFAGSTTTEYAVVIGGATNSTTSSVSGLGTSTQVLTSQGPGMPPVWSDAGGGGITTIDGDSGSITGSTVTIFANNSSNNSGSSVQFVNSGTTSTLNLSDSNGNTILGKVAGNATISGTYSTGVGYQSLHGLTGGYSNAALGTNSLYTCTTGYYNSATGHSSLFSLSTGAFNTAVGYQAIYSATGSNNTAVGATSLNQCVGGQNNTCLGTSSGGGIVSGNNNVIIGFQAGYENDFSSCVGVGEYALYYCNGNNNTSVGYRAIDNITTGTNNIALGYQAGHSLATSDSSNILIGNTGTGGVSNAIVIGTQGSGAGQQNSCTIAGIYGVTVTGTAVLCSSTGVLGTVASSIRYKQDVVPVDESVSVLSLEPKKFAYKSDPEKKPQYGLIAEEVENAFPYLCFYKEDGTLDSVKYHELPTLLLHEIKKLNARIEVLEKAK